MTINEYMKSFGAIPETERGQAIFQEIGESMDIWSNDACRGYCIMAMQEAGIDEETIRRTVRGLYQFFDLKSIEEAEQAYRNF